MASSLLKGGIRIYKSFSDAETGEYQIEKKRSSLDGLKDTIDLISKVYGTTREDLNKKPFLYQLKIKGN
ncbi:MAG TPA: hypothetical protein VF691_22700 [Cytophagaceae bacterium]|jgi:hypothetical protein